MVKRLLCLLLLVLLLPLNQLSLAEADNVQNTLQIAGEPLETDAVSATEAPAAAEDRPMVNDECGLFSASEIRTMEELITEIRDTYQMDVTVVTTQDTPYDSSDSMSKAMSWADAYYDDNGYGLGDDRAGLVYVLDMKNRVPLISTNGVMIDYLTDSRLDQLFSCSEDELYDGHYGQAVLAVLRRLKTMLQSGIEEGQFRYDAATGERLTGLYNRLTLPELLVAIAAGLLTCGLIIGLVSARYHLRGHTYRYDEKANTRLDQLQENRTLINRTVSRFRHDSNSGGPGGHGGGTGGGHGSSVRSGGHGGGHGGHF